MGEALHALKLAAYVFGVIFVAELPDKTALATLVMATRHKPLPVFLGASLALTVQSVVAVAAGSLLSLLPARAVHVGAGCVFLASAVAMWMRKGDVAVHEAEGEKKDHGPAAVSFWCAATTVFSVVFIAEWGDLTQFATAAFAAHEKAPLIVFCAATLALWAVAGIAVGIGNRAAKVLDERITARIAAALFVAVGVALLAGWM
jgi:putative Ca2+/H+ antiporter (TMEM165/GDT1 family)